MKKVELTLASQAEPLTVSMEAQPDGTIQFEYEDQKFNTQLLGNGQKGVLNLQGRIIPFYTARVKEELHLWMAGKIIRFKLPETGSRRNKQAQSGNASNDVKSPMPGTILKIPVKVGDTVEANQPLLIMESMKMEMTMAAPKAGIIATINCTEGQLVDMGSILITLKESD